MNLFDDKKLLSHIDIIYKFCDFENGRITIHINGIKKDDYPRMAFNLFTLGRAYASGFIKDTDGKKKQELLSLFWRVYTYSQENEAWKDDIYVKLYGMRFLEQLGEDYSIVINDFRGKDYRSLYGNLVTAYIYMPTYLECSALRETYDYAEEIFLQCKEIFDFILYSNTEEEHPPFHFSELSACSGFVESHIQERAYKNIQRHFDNGYLNPLTGSSCIAKCMEDFARRGEDELLTKCFTFLEKRSTGRFINYIRSDYSTISQYLYTEKDDSQYICLDTNAHLIHTYINLYEKNK